MLFVVLGVKEFINKMGIRKIILVVDWFLKIFLNFEIVKKKYIIKVKKNWRSQIISKNNLSFLKKIFFILCVWINLIVG